MSLAKQIGLFRVPRPTLAHSSKIKNLKRVAGSYQLMINIRALYLWQIWKKPTLFNGVKSIFLKNEEQLENNGSLNVSRQSFYHHNTLFLAFNMRILLLLHNLVAFASLTEFYSFYRKPFLPSRGNVSVSFPLLMISDQQFVTKLSIFRYTGKKYRYRDEIPVNTGIRFSAPVCSSS